MVTPSANVAEVLFGKTRRALLGLFFTRPTEAFHFRQVVRLSGAGVGPAQRELKELCAAGLITRDRQGSQVIYRANAASPLFAEMKSLILKTIGAAEVLRQALEPLAPQIHAACLFGSLARGEPQPHSDVDLLVISDALKLQDLVTALLPAQHTLGREVNPMLYRLAEFKKKVRDRSPFLTRVLAHPKVPLIGDLP
jgi:predicted nucleotidyltransferase